jgi:hypothetical protein
MVFLKYKGMKAKSINRKGRKEIIQRSQRYDKNEEPLRALRPLSILCG